MADEKSPSPQEVEALRQQVEELRRQVQGAKDELPTTVLAKRTRESAVKDEKFHDKWDFQCFKKMQGHSQKIYSSRWSPDNSLICSVAIDGLLIVWDSKTGQKDLVIPLTSNWATMTCDFSPTGELIAHGGLDNQCSIWEIANQTGFLDNALAWRTLTQHEGYISGVRFLTKDKLITSSGDSNCILWDVNKRQGLRSFNDHAGDVTGLSVPRVQGKINEDIFLSSSCDATVKLWDVRSGKCTQNYDDHAADVDCVEWFPDGQAFVSGCTDSECRLFDTRAAGKRLNTFKDQNVVGGTTSLSFSQSGRLMFVGYDDEPHCLAWDVLHAEIFNELEHEERVSNVEVSPDGFTVSTVSWDQLIRFWTKKP